MRGSYERDVRLSQAAGWRLAWGRQGWRVSNAEPLPPALRRRYPGDEVIRYTLLRTPDARHPPGTPDL